jgi:hypothetical protein
MFLLKKIFFQCEFREYQLNKIMKLICKSDIYERIVEPSESIFCSGNHLHKTELTIGSYYDLS